MLISIQGFKPKTPQWTVNVQFLSVMPAQNRKQKRADDISQFCKRSKWNLTLDSFQSFV